MFTVFTVNIDKNPKLELIYNKQNLTKYLVCLGVKSEFICSVRRANTSFMANCTHPNFISISQLVQITKPVGSNEQIIILH